MNNDTNDIIHPPFRSKPRLWRKGWAKKFRFGRFYLYISNCRMKKRPIRDLMYQGVAVEHVVENKRKLYERQGGVALIAVSLSTMSSWNYITSFLSHGFLNWGSRYATASCSAIAATRKCIAIPILTFA